MKENSVNVPMLDQLASKLREEIETGTYGTRGAGRIPSTASLARQWNTTRATIYAVLQLLQAEGIIYERHQSLIVNYPVLALEGLTKNFEGELKEKGYEEVTVTNVIEPIIEVMPHYIAAIFGQEEGVHVVHRMRKQGLADLPLRIAENWYPASLAKDLLEQMRKDDKMDVIGAIKEKHGLYIVKSEDVVIARIPNKFEREQLDLIRTEPVIEIRRSNFAEDGTVLMWNKIIHRATQFKLTYKYPVNHWK